MRLLTTKYLKAIKIDQDMSPLLKLVIEISPDANLDIELENLKVFILSIRRRGD